MVNLKLDKKYIFIFCFFMCLFFVGGVFSSSLKGLLGVVLNYQEAIKFYWILVAAILFTHHLRFSGVRVATPAPQMFVKFGETVFTGLTYGMAGGTSILLMRGLYNQYFYNDVVFVNFSDYDLGSLFVVSSFLIYFCVIHLAALAYDVIKLQNTADVVSQSPDMPDT